jgi:hypothetical protein
VIGGKKLLTEGLHESYSSPNFRRMGLHDDQNKGDEKGGGCSKHRREENFI